MTWRRILLLSSVFLLLLLGGGWFVLRSRGARDLVVTALGSLLACRFELEAADLDLTGGALTLQQLRLDDPARPGTSLLQLGAARVEAQLDPFGSLLAVRSVDLDGLALDLDLQKGLPRPDQLLKKQPPARPGAAPLRLPAIRLANGSLRVQAIPAAPPLTFTDLQVTCLPREGDDTLLQLDGSLRCVELAVPLRLEGTADLHNGSLRAVARVEQVRIDGAFLKSLAPFLPDAAPREGIGALVDELTFWLEVPGTPAAPGAGRAPEPVAGLRLVLSGVECTLPDVPYPIHDAKVEVTATSAQQGLARARFRSHRDTGDVDASAVVGSLFGKPVIEIRASGKRLRIDDDMLRALRAFPAGRNVTAALQPTAGSADAELYIRHLGGDDERVELDLDVHEAQLTFRGFGSRKRIGFPLPLASARGKVRLRGDSIRIDDVVATVAPVAGGGEVHCNGRVDFPKGQRDKVHLDIRSRQLQFTPSMREALAVLLGDTALWDQFGPGGSAAVHVQVRPFDDPDGEWKVQVEPLDASACWQRFPLPVRQLHGKVTVDAGGVELDLQAAAGGGMVDLRGQLLPDADGGLGHGPLQLRIQAQDLKLDPGLQQAALTFLPGLRPAVERLQPSGTCGAVLNVWSHQLGQPLRYDLAFGLEHGALHPRGMPLQLLEANGNLFVHGDGDQVQVDLDALRGQVVGAQGTASAGAPLAAVGTLRRGGEFQDDLTVVVRDLPLDAELAATLHGIGALDRGTWDVLAPSGRVDTVFAWQREAQDQPPQQRLSVHLRDVRSDARMLPGPATAMTGELLVRDNVLTFREVHARIADTPVTCTEGEVRDHGDGRTELGFTVGTERFPLDDGIANLFQGPLRQAILDRQLRGRMNVDRLRLQFLIPPAGGAGEFATVVQGRLDALDVSMLLGTRLQAISGSIQVDRSEVTGSGGGLQGKMERGSFQMFRHPCVDFRARFTADAQKIGFTDLSFGLHGGRVHSRTAEGEALAYVLPQGDPRGGLLSFDLTAQGISWKDLLHQSGFTGGGYYGTLAGELKLNSLRGSDLVGMDAEGSIGIADGYLGTVPLFTSIYALMAEASRPRFESFRTRFQVRDRKVKFDELTLGSSLVAVTGQGSMTLDGYVDVVLTIDTLFGGSADILVAPKLFQMIASWLVRFHLFGHLRDLQAEQRSFAERDPRRQPLLPVPPRIERPRRRDF